MGLERPEVDLATANDNVQSHLVILERGEDVLRTIEESIDDGLDTVVLSSIPHLDDLVGSQTDQMVTLLIDIEMGY
jgi:hypothetical protein